MLATSFAWSGGATGGLDRGDLARAVVEVADDPVRPPPRRWWLPCRHPAASPRPRCSSAPRSVIGARRVIAALRHLIDDAAGADRLLHRAIDAVIIGRGLPQAREAGPVAVALAADVAGLEATAVGMVANIVRTIIGIARAPPYRIASKTTIMVKRKSAGKKQEVVL